MAFWLYKRSGQTYERVSSVRLTGPTGVLAQFLTAHRDEDTPFTWDLAPSALIRLIDPGCDPAEHELVIDLIPEGLIDVCLHRVVGIQGSSDYDETDMVIGCKALYQGRVNRSTADFKRNFTLEKPGGDRTMLEAFRLTGGTRKGKYLWARPRMDIGAAVCPASDK